MELLEFVNVMETVIRIPKDGKFHAYAHLLDPEHIADDDVEYTTTKLVVERKPGKHINSIISKDLEWQPHSIYSDSIFFRTVKKTMKVYLYYRRSHPSEIIDNERCVIFFKDFDVPSYYDCREFHLYNLHEEETILVSDLLKYDTSFLLVHS